MADYLTAEYTMEVMRVPGSVAIALRYISEELVSDFDIDDLLCTNLELDPGIYQSENAESGRTSLLLQSLAPHGRTRLALHDSPRGLR